MSRATLGLGCAPIGNLYESITDDDAIAVVHAAYDAGIRFFDTAPLYGHGLSERRLGAALASLPRDELTICTKVGRLLVDDDPTSRPDPTIFTEVPPVHPVFDFSADGVKRSLEASLERLGVDRVDIVHVHDPDDHAEEALACAFPVLRHWRDHGVVGAIGAGMNQAALLARFVREAGIDCVLLAGRFTLLDQTGLDGLLPLCEREQVSVIAAGVFNSGLLANPSPGASFFYEPAPEPIVHRARELAAVCQRHGVPLTAAALQLPTAHPAVHHVLTGVQSVAELRANVTDFTRPVPPALWSDLKAEGLLPEHVPTP
ncbi:MAG TPA: aldo/keto reductase [Acidimicrobiales bacterium]|jgi:D-threo-aldose 1-dehydrogenase|nr:aldo/keto reductase [Acidimicrobiales bacterium]